MRVLNVRHYGGKELAPCHILTAVFLVACLTLALVPQDLKITLVPIWIRSIRNFVAQQADFRLPTGGLVVT